MKDIIIRYLINLFFVVLGVGLLVAIVWSMENSILLFLILFSLTIAGVITIAQKQFG